MGHHFIILDLSLTVAIGVVTASLHVYCSELRTCRDVIPRETAQQGMWQWGRGRWLMFEVNSFSLASEGCKLVDLYMAIHVYGISSLSLNVA